jgi:hypothetical protein
VKFDTLECRKMKGEDWNAMSCLRLEVNFLTFQLAMVLREREGLRTVEEPEVSTLNLRSQEENEEKFNRSVGKHPIIAAGRIPLEWGVPGRHSSVL